MAVQQAARSALTRPHQDRPVTGRQCTSVPAAEQPIPVSLVPAADGQEQAVG